jgi:hypothetical protein
MYTATMTIGEDWAFMPLDLELCQKSEEASQTREISLHQALLVVARDVNWTPVPEAKFRALAGLTPPNDVAAKRSLILAIVEGRLRHKGQLWLNSSNSTAPELLATEYRATSDLWSAERLCFQSSELDLGRTTLMLEAQRIEGCFKLTRIVVSLEDLLQLSGSPSRSKGGRPTKWSGRQKASCCKMGQRPATVSRWLAEWAEDGTIARERQGKSKRALTVIMR